jgi:hypothetical protein
LTAASISVAFKSFIFAVAISSNWALVTFPTFSEFGVPLPLLRPALGQHGVNLMDFCNAFNSKTNELEKNLPVPVVITVYEDRSFDFIVKTTPASVL